MQEFNLELYRYHIESFNSVLRAIPNSRLRVDGPLERIISKSTYPFAQAFSTTTKNALSYDAVVPDSVASLDLLVGERNVYRLLELGLYRPMKEPEMQDLFSTSLYVAEASRDEDGIFVNATHHENGDILSHGSIMEPEPLDRFFQTLRSALDEAFPSLKEYL